MNTERKEFCDGLRAVADWLEAHPDLALPQSDVSCYALDTKEEAAHTLKNLAPCEKIYTEGLFYISRRFGPVILRYAFNRDSVCTLKVVGKREVPETVIEARPEQIIPAHTVDITEWECAPILHTADAETEAT